MALHFLCGLLAAVSAVSIGCPFDVVKTRMQSKNVQYNGVIDCIARTLRFDGPSAFYKGVVPMFLRNASWNITMFITLEQIKKVVFQAPKKE